MSRAAIATGTAFATLLVAGCGGGTSAGGTPTTAGATTAAPTTAAAPAATDAAAATTTTDAGRSATSAPSDICGYAQIIASSFSHKASTTDEQRAFASSVTAALDAIGREIPAEVAGAWKTDADAIKSFFAAEAAANYDPKVFLSSKDFQAAMVTMASQQVADASSKVQAWVAQRCPNLSN